MQSREATRNLNEEQAERMATLFAILIALFERAYLVAYGSNLPPRKARRWAELGWAGLGWEDFMREWCRREDFRRSLPRLLPGEDPEFTAYISRIANEEGAEA